MIKKKRIFGQSKLEAIKHHRRKRPQYARSIFLFDAFIGFFTTYFLTYEMAKVRFTDVSKFS
jgi:hypothetical protein